MRLLRPDHPKTQPFSLICSDISMAATMDIGNQSYPYSKDISGSLLLQIRAASQNSKTNNVQSRDSYSRRTLNWRLFVVFQQPLAATSVPTKMVYKIDYQFLKTMAWGRLVVDIGDELRGLDTTVIDLTGTI